VLRIGCPLNLKFAASKGGLFVFSDSEGHDCFVVYPACGKWEHRAEENPQRIAVSLERNRTQSVTIVHSRHIEDNLRRIRIVKIDLIYGGSCARKLFDREDALSSTIAAKIPYGCRIDIGWAAFHTPKVRPGQNLANRHVGRIKCGERIIGHPYVPNEKTRYLCEARLSKGSRPEHAKTRKDRQQRYAGLELAACRIGVSTIAVTRPDHNEDAWPTPPEKSATYAPVDLAWILPLITCEGKGQS